MYALTCNADFVMVSVVRFHIFFRLDLIFTLLCHCFCVGVKTEKSIHYSLNTFMCKVTMK